jgi:hypothetical protein
MAGATISDVSLYSKERGKGGAPFNLTLSYDGIAIQPPGEPARHLQWNRITEWEIRQRRGGVLLILRGGGAVTPLIIPKWTVDDLDLVLRDVTSGLPDPDSVPGRAPYDISVDEVEAPGAHAFPMTDTEPPPAPVEDANLWTETEPPEGLDTVLWPEDETVPSDPPTVPSAEPARESPVSGGNGVVDMGSGDLDSGLVWPNKSPLDDVPDLVWPDEDEQATPSATAFPPKEGGSTAMRDSSAPWVIEDVPGLPTLPAAEVPRVDAERQASSASPAPPPVEAAPPAVVEQPKVVRLAYEEPVQPRQPVQIPPYEPLPVERASKREAQPRAERRARERSGGSTKVIVTVVLLAALATAVALVLAESAGAIHLSILGT